MGMEQRTYFALDKAKCIKCGSCINVCSGMVLERDVDDYPKMISFPRFGWSGCWRCEHCLAVCPKGAISIFKKEPEDSLPVPPTEMGSYMEQLITNRRSCRRYRDRNVEPGIIDRILSAMTSVPTGGNTCSVEYTIIDDKNRVKEIRDVAYHKMEEAAKKRIYTSTFSSFYYSKMKQSEKTVRKGDLLFCGAPHLFIAHQQAIGKWAEDSKADCIIATAYFELLANAFGLGTIIMSYAADVLKELAPEAKDMLNIPSDHYMGLIVGFGYPEITYARGVQKERRGKIHRWSKEKRR